MQSLFANWLSINIRRKGIGVGIEVMWLLWNERTLRSSQFERLILRNRCKWLVASMVMKYDRQCHRSYLSQWRSS